MGGSFGTNPLESQANGRVYLNCSSLCLVASAWHGAFLAANRVASTAFVSICRNNDSEAQKCI